MAAYSVYYLAALLISPGDYGSTKAIAVMFVATLGLFAMTDRKIEAKHLGFSAIISVASGVLVPLAYLLIFISSQGPARYTVFNIPVIFFTPIALTIACLVFSLFGFQSKKRSKHVEEN